MNKRGAVLQGEHITITITADEDLAYRIMESLHSELETAVKDYDFEKAEELSKVCEDLYHAYRVLREEREQEEYRREVSR